MSLWVHRCWTSPTRRHLGVLGGTINYWVESGFRPGFYPKAGQRREVRRSIMFVAAVAVPYFAALVYFTGVPGLLLYFVAPWIATHAWFSATTLMHHSSSDVPYLTAEYWTRNASRTVGHHGLRLPQMAAVPHPQHRHPHGAPRGAGGAVLQPAPAR